MNLKFLLLTVIIVCVSSHVDCTKKKHGKAVQNGGTGAGSATRKLTATAMGLLVAGSAALAHAGRPASGPGFEPGPAQQVEGLYHPPHPVPPPMYPGGPVHTELEKQRLRQLGISELPHSRAYALQQHHRKMQESEQEAKTDEGKSQKSKRRGLTELPALSGDIAVHDPTLVQCGSKWIMYSSYNGCEERESDDLVTWRRPTASSCAFNPPGLSWANTWTSRPNHFIAPHVSGPYNGLYYLYYAVPGTRFVQTHVGAIGVATSATGLPGSWQDHGQVILSRESDPFNCMDPNLFVDTASGRWWLTFGSAQQGIYQVELDPRNGKCLDKNPAPIKIARAPNNGAYSPSLIERNGWYYLFVSWGKDGASSIYYGYAKTPQGPFMDREEKPMLNGYGTVLYAGTSAQVGCGGQSIVRAADKDIMAYHYHAGSATGASTLGLKYLDWTDDGWPYLSEIENGCGC